MKKILVLLFAFVFVLSIVSYASNADSIENKENNISDDFVLIKGNKFQMGSPEDEAWRGDDEKLHNVTVSDFYMSKYEVTQEEYEKIMNVNPSNFKGDKLPVENVSWLDAVTYCNKRSESENLSPVYTINGQDISWDRSKNGYRLPTEAEWEYACRAGTKTPFYIENSPSAQDANYYGHYPYGIEDNYFTQNKLDVKPGSYRETTIPVGSFKPNPYGLYDMYGNVSEWVFDYYGEYPTNDTVNPTGPKEGTLRVYRGGGWNDFAKNMRSAYRAAAWQNKYSFNLGFRLVRNAVKGNDIISVNFKKTEESNKSKILIAYFSWSGNTRSIANEIKKQTGADIFEIKTKKAYSSNYNTVLNEAQHDQNINARPELSNYMENIDDYDTIIIGYPNWWASIPMPVATFLEKYDFKGKTIIPFCSHGGGRFGQSLTAISKLTPNASMGEALSVHYSGGTNLDKDIKDWLKKNNIKTE